MAKIRKFGNTWWGKAWLDALEQRALVDPNRLPRGRTYARKGQVRDLELSPGRLQAQVAGSRSRPYSTSLSLRILSDHEWDNLLDTIMSKASNVAALLAGEVPPVIGDLVLPDRGDLGPECSCPDWAEPCKHAAALCYIAADLFDEDPFALLTLRGRDRESVLNEVRVRRSVRLGVSMQTSSDHPRGSDPGTSAAKAYRAELRPLERAPSLVPRPGSMVALAVPPSADSGIDADELRSLVADAAARAWSMLAGVNDSQLGLSVGADVVRRAVDGDIETIAAQTGVDAVELRAAVTAWQIGGVAGFGVHAARTDTDPELMEGARAVLGNRAKVRANTVSLDDRQLRVDEDGRWWRFRFDNELGWLLADGPADDPTDLEPQDL